MMFQVGSRVVYGIHGVCEIRDEEVKRIDSKNVTYLVLEPLGQPGSRYLVPTHNPAAMGKLKTILTGEEMTALLHSSEVRQDCWIQDESRRKQTYRELISSGDRVRLMAMVHTLYRHRNEQTAVGRKMHLCDDNFLRDAEKLLISEVSVAMEMDGNTAKQFIRNCLKDA